MQRAVILAHRGDELAEQIHSCLLTRLDASRLSLVSMESLCLAPRFGHWLDDKGVGSRIELHDGSVLDDESIGVVLNRLTHVELPSFAEASRSYATAEMFALLLSWLASLSCPVVDPPSAVALAGTVASDAEWELLASRAGLPTAGYRESAGSIGRRRGAPAPNGTRAVVEDESWALVVGERVVGPRADDHRAALIDLSRALRRQILPVRFVRRPETEGWVAASVAPLLGATDPSVAESIAELLCLRLERAS